MTLSGLLHYLKHLPAYRALLEATPDEPQALLPSARAFVVAGLRMHTGKAVVLVTARSEMANQMATELESWLPPVDEGGPPVLLFAEPDALPYERIPWSGATRQRRLTALAALQSRTDAPPPIVVTSARALMQMTLPPRELRLSLRPVRVGGVVRLEQMITNWAQTGYNPAEVVEEPGTFARRGGIIDVWPPNMPYPVRIDLFGDEVDSLRLFDPATQRTIRKVGTVDIGPGGEALSKYGPNALTRLKVEGGNLSAPQNLTGDGVPATPLLDPNLLLAVREELRLDVERLADSHAFHGIEWYLPYFYERPGSLLDYTDDALLVVDDAADLTATLTELEAQVETLRDELVRSGELPREVLRGYFTNEEIRVALLARRPLLLGMGDLYGKTASANTPLARSFVPGPRYGGKVKEIGRDMAKFQGEGQTIALVTRQAARIQETLADVDLIAHVQVDVDQPPPPRSITLVQGVYGEGFVMRGGDSKIEESRLKIGGAGVRRSCGRPPFRCRRRHA